MAVLIGGRPPLFGIDNSIQGTPARDVVFGDPFTTGNPEGVLAVGGVLDTGRGGDDRLDGRAGDDFVFGDAAQMAGTGRGGDDLVRGGAGDDFLGGDADLSLTGRARGGDDTVEGGTGTTSSPAMLARWTVRAAAGTTG